jgi:hypothetical protein
MAVFRVSTQNGPENFTGSFEVLAGGVLQVSPVSGFRQLMAPGYWLRVEVSDEG